MVAASHPETEEASQTATAAESQEMAEANRATEEVSLARIEPARAAAQ